MYVWFFTLLVIYIKRIDGAISLATEMNFFKELPYRRHYDNNDLEAGGRESDQEEESVSSSERLRERVCFLSLYISISISVSVSIFFQTYFYYCYVFETGMCTFFN